MKPAPDFSLIDQDNNLTTLSDYKNKWLVLYFYPKDNTPGCTTEACTFRDERDAIAEFGGAEVIGINKDSVKSHKKFAGKNKLNFKLLSDPEKKAIKAYGAWGPKKFLGRDYFGISRNTYVINPDGMIVKEYLGVNPKTHAGQIIADLKKLQAA
jgi:peroxiredoxin Q/BCP